MLREEDERELTFKNSSGPLLTTCYASMFITLCFALKLCISLWMFGITHSFNNARWGGSPEKDLCKIPIGRLAFLCFFPGLIHVAMIVTLAKYIGDALTEFDDYDAITFPWCIVRKKYRVKYGFVLRGVVKQGVPALGTQKPSLSLTQQPSTAPHSGTENQIPRSPPSSSSDTGNKINLKVGFEFEAVKTLDGIDPNEKFTFTDVGS